MKFSFNAPPAAAPRAGRAASNRATPKSRAFTLIELLVVIVVIAILMGMVFRMIGMVSRSGDRARTVARLERVANAIEEFYAEFGQYPPVPYYAGGQPLAYEFPIQGGMRANIARQLAQSDPEWGTEDNRAVIFTFGLMSFLLPRYEGRAEQSWENSLLQTSQWNEHNETAGDLEEDLQIIQRWQPQLDGIVAGDIRSRSFGRNVYTNYIATVRDAWDRELRYQSPPPHQRYRLWSVGPDGQNETDDDIEVGKWGN